MTWVRIGIVASLLLCVWIAWPKDRATPPRPLLIKSALKQADDPIVLLGDSIVRQSSLPRTICKRTVVNAGIDGSTTASGLAEMLKKAIGDKKASIIVVSLGMNDADTAVSLETYKANYAALLTVLKGLSGKLAVATVTGLEIGKPEVGRRSQQVIDGYNAALPDIAQGQSASVIAVPPMPAGYTTDGIHLSESGYATWEKVIKAGVEAALCPGT